MLGNHNPLTKAGRCLSLPPFIVSARSRGISDENVSIVARVCDCVTDSSIGSIQDSIMDQIGLWAESHLKRCRLCVCHTRVEKYKVIHWSVYVRGY